ncbi:phage tail protein [Sedimenticola selenatireducens]|nr:phage tail protein [Sedimenticola selenatireducens]
MPTAIAGAIISAVGATGIVASLITAAVNIGFSLVMGAIFKPKQPKGGGGFTAEATDRTVVVRSPISPHRIIYGEAQVSGTLAFADVTGSDPKYLHMVIVLSGREVEEIGTVYFNDIPETDSRWSGHIRINRHLGSPDQLADSDLVAESALWTSNHRLRGRAYIYVRLKQSRDVFPTGIPNIKAVLKGHQVYDPRTTLTVYSTNAALCALDYLRWEYGFGALSSEIDNDSWIANANACDELVTIDAEGTTQQRYTCNGTFTLDRSPLDVLEELKSTFAGAAVWSMGTWQGHAGVAIAPTGAIDEDDLRGSIKYRYKPGRAKQFNAVRGTFVNPDDHWQPTDFTPVTNSYYEGLDGGQRIYEDIALDFCTDPIEAQRNAKIALEVHRQSLTATLPMMLGAGLKYRPWQVVPITIGPLGWSAKPFLILDWKLVEEDGGLGVDLLVQEYSAECFDWNFGEATTRDLTPNTNLLDPSIILPPTGIQLVSGTTELLVGGDGTVISRLRVDWINPSDATVQQVDIQYKRTVDTGWTSVNPARSGETTAWISPVLDGERYDVRLRSVNSWGVRSAWEYAYNHLVLGKSLDPSDVSQFFVDRQPDGTRQFSWLPVTDADLAGYLIRYRLGTGWDWDDMSPLHEGLLMASPWETNQLAAGTYTVGIKAIDRSGNESVNARIIQSTLGDPRIKNALAYEGAHLQGWPGTKTNCAADNAGGTLTALGNYTWDDLTTWDAWASWAQNPYTQIIYEHLKLDLGASVAFNPLITANASATPVIEISTSVDDIAWTSWSVPAGQVTARYLKVRVTVNQAASEIPQIQTLVIIAGGESLEEDINDQATSGWAGSAAAGRTVPLQKTYATITSVQVALQNVGPGWSWEVLSKSTAGPVIRIYDNNDTPADATVDVVIKGVPNN